MFYNSFKSRNISFYSNFFIEISLIIFSYYQSQMKYLGNSINIADKKRFLASDLIFLDNLFIYLSTSLSVTLGLIAWNMSNCFGCIIIICLQLVKIWLNAIIKNLIYI